MLQTLIRLRDKRQEKKVSGLKTRVLLPTIKSQTVGICSLSYILGARMHNRRDFSESYKAGDIALTIQGISSRVQNINLNRKTSILPPQRSQENRPHLLHRTLKSRNGANPRESLSESRGKTEILNHQNQPNLEYKGRNSLKCEF